jgi:hypothetical protein
VIENIKAANHPLTIIAIFAALTEVACTVALAIVDKDIQHIFAWFIMLFSILLVVMFFVTLNFNAKVLYALSGFKDEENFPNTLNGTCNASQSLEVLAKQLEEAKDKILSESIEQISTIGGAEKSKLSTILNNQLSKIEDRLSSIRCTTEVAALAKAPSSRRILESESRLEAEILQFFVSGSNMSADDISQQTGISLEETKRVLEHLMERGLIVGIEHADGVIYYS